MPGIHSVLFKFRTQTCISREVSKEESLEAECQEGGSLVEGLETGGPKEVTREVMEDWRKWRHMETRATPSRM